MTKQYTLIYYQQINAIDCIYTLQDSNGINQTYQNTIIAFNLIYGGKRNGTITTPGTMD